MSVEGHENNKRENLGLDEQVRSGFVITFQLGIFQRDEIYRVHILEHVLPISKQTPNLLASAEC